MSEQDAEKVCKFKKWRHLGLERELFIDGCKLVVKFSHIDFLVHTITSPQGLLLSSNTSELRANQHSVEIHEEKNTYLLNLVALFKELSHVV